jgi:hypothetical protein
VGDKGARVRLKIGGVFCFFCPAASFSLGGVFSVCIDSCVKTAAR